jgi:esterase/lipase superfamily enzyme
MAVLRQTFGGIAVWKLFALCCVVALAGCGKRGEITLYPAAKNVGKQETIFVGTTRAVDPATGSFGDQRSRTMSFARYEISIPPVREVGRIEWPGKNGKIDPETQFLTTGATVFETPEGFRQNLAREFRKMPAGKRSATIFVHGFNNTFAEGLYRLAQLANDLDVPKQIVHYSWPSAGEPLGYVQDRDSTLIARDGFEDLLNEVIAAGSDDVLLTCHSMGCQLMMEAMRQIEIRDPGRPGGGVGGVVMLSPDIDVEVFHAQAMAFETLPDPFFIFSSEKDKALRLSSFITGQPDRLGNIKDLTPVSDLKVTVLDTTEFSTGSGHLNVGESPALIAMMDDIREVQSSLDQDRAGRPGLLPGMVLTARAATEIVVSPVVALEEAAN